MSNSLPKPDLEDANEKLHRARDHIADVNTRISRFLTADFYRLRLEEDKREGRMKIVFDSLHQPDKQINAVIGDAVSNLRSTLDYIAVSLVKPFGDTEKVGFPFGDDRNNFKGRVRAKDGLAACPADIQDLLINEVEAYYRGKGHTLWVLNKLRNIDKHRFLVSTVSIAGIRCSFSDRSGSIFTNCGFGVTAGQNGTFIDAPIGHIQFTEQPRPTFTVDLSEPPYIERTPVVDFLNLAASGAQSLLNTLDVFFRRE